MNTAQLVLQLPIDEIEFIKEYAQSQGLTPEELLDRYIMLLRTKNDQTIHDEVKKITGILPSEIDGEQIYHSSLLEKHR